ncbi:hypothetical protein EON81_23150 [bacterium]|nr:MAG: hypothetical protein EON81_23150 [bacterium]
MKIETGEYEMPAEIDFSKGIRGKYYQRATGRPLPIDIEPDLRERFPDAHSVNEALRRYLELTSKV